MGVISLLFVLLKTLFVLMGIKTEFWSLPLSFIRLEEGAYFSRPCPLPWREVNETTPPTSQLLEPFLSLPPHT